MLMVTECFDLESKKEFSFSSETGVREFVSGKIEENWFDFSAAEDFSKLSAGEQRSRVEADLRDVRKNKLLSTGRKERLMRFFLSMKNLMSLSAVRNSEETEFGEYGNRLARRSVRSLFCFTQVSFKKKYFFNDLDLAHLNVSFREFFFFFYSEKVGRILRDNDFYFKKKMCL